ncbi:hypothetical protein WA158_008327 [Blastocystis sp. Blastoise]
MSWIPNTEVFQFLVDILNEINTLGENSTNDLYQKLEKYKKQPDSVYYLSYIYAYGEENSVKLSVRTYAGYYLKTILNDKNYILDLDHLEYIKESIRCELRDESSCLKQLTRSLVTSTLRRISIANWPELFQCLYDILISYQKSCVEDVFLCLSQIVEDCDEELQSDSMAVLIPFLEPLLNSMCVKQNNIRNSSLQCLYNILLLKTTLLDHYYDIYINNLFQLSSDSSITVRSMVISSLSELFFQNPSIFLSCYPSFFSILCILLKDTDSTISTQATDFWTAFIEVDYDTIQSVLYTYISQVIPIVLKNIRLEESEIYDISSSPFFLVSSSIHSHSYSEHVKDDIFNITYGEWTLRKASGTCLEQYASYYPDLIIPYCTESILESLYSSEWITQEMAVVALAAMANGAQTQLYPYLPTFIKVLFPILCDPPNTSLFSSITWTLGKYSLYILEREKQSFLPNMIHILLQASDQPNPLLQRASYLWNLAKHYSDHFSQGNYPEMTLDILINRWKSLGNLEEGMIYVMNSLSNVIYALGDKMDIYIEDIYKRIMSIIEESFNIYDLKQEKDEEENDEDEDEIFLISSSFGLLSTIIETAPSKISLLLEHSSLLSSLYKGCVSTSDSLRISSFYLLGTISFSLFPLISTSVSQVIQLCFQYIDIQYPEVTSSCLWTLGVLFNNIQQDTSSYISILYIFTLYIYCTSTIHPLLSKDFGTLCSCLSYNDNNQEKNDSCLGIIDMIHYDPELLNKYYKQIMELITSWGPTVDQNLATSFSKILFLFKENHLSEWSIITQTIPTNVLISLQSIYQFE